MVMVEYFANSPTCALGDFACALGGADTDVLASDGSAFGDIASGVEWVECDKVARTFPDTLGRRSSALGGSFADVSGAPTDVATGAAMLGLLLGGRLRCVGMLRRGLGLAALTRGVLAADGKCESEERDYWFWECGSHGLNLAVVRFDSSAEDSLSKAERLPKAWMMRTERSMQDRYENPAWLKKQMRVDSHRIRRWCDSKQMPAD
jgi:hypothetical protein